VRESIEAKSKEIFIVNGERLGDHSLADVLRERTANSHDLSIVRLQPRRGVGNALAVAWATKAQNVVNIQRMSTAGCGEDAS
jgi:hypothetical protein